jgi:soluble lytic murein transglycosylase
VSFVAAWTFLVTDRVSPMLAIPCAETPRGLALSRRPLALALATWALFSMACATTTATGSNPHPRSSDTILTQPHSGAGQAPDAAPILDSASIESSSLIVAREILQDRAPQLDELQKEGVARAVVRAESDHGLPALLVLALIEQESHFRPKVSGPRGSIGLMQIRPYVAKDIAKRHNIPWQGIRTLTDPVKNVRLGTIYLAEMRKRFDDTNLAMAAYNIGPTAVSRRLRRGLSVKGPYVKGVLRRYHSMRLVFGDPTTAIGG